MKRQNRVDNDHAQTVAQRILSDSTIFVDGGFQNTKSELPWT